MKVFEDDGPDAFDFGHKSGEIGSLYECAHFRIGFKIRAPACVHSGLSHTLDESYGHVTGRDVCPHSDVVAENIDKSFIIVQSKLRFLGALKQDSSMSVFFDACTLRVCVISAVTARECGEYVHRRYEERRHLRQGTMRECVSVVLATLDDTFSPCIADCVHGIQRDVGDVNTVIGSERIQIVDMSDFRSICSVIPLASASANTIRIQFGSQFLSMAFVSKCKTTMCTCRTPLRRDSCGREFDAVGVASLCWLRPVERPCLRGFTRRSLQQQICE